MRVQDQKVANQRLHGTILEGKTMGLDPQKKKLKGERAHDLKNQNAS
jgi:hypothetical protein